MEYCILYKVRYKSSNLRSRINRYTGTWQLATGTYSNSVQLDSVLLFMIHVIAHRRMQCAVAHSPEKLYSGVLRVLGSRAYTVLQRVLAIPVVLVLEYDMQME